ncbi:MOSC domain-containing protein [Actinoplanes subtropicus]|uniref:MOSC domain-containing protein n=1 Tax=Actinoplanes subtropicus TaxID=543632 RepID=UPI0004C3C034|nr:MOSC N-terminal beta barrel domain-containing protein [Actinoplanes subtropicus]
MPRIVALRRYPLKSARGESLTVARVEPGGLAGDRAWACVDPADGTVGSAKHPRRWGGLLAVGARVAGADLRVSVGGSEYAAADAEPALARHLGRAVRLTREVPAGARLHRTLPGVDGMVPDWLSGLRPGEDAITAAGGGGAGGFADFAPVHVVTTGALARLGAAASRFRPNILLDADDDPPDGAELRLGDVVLRIMSPTPRCVIPSLAHGPDVPPDTELLRTLARHYRVPVAGLGKAACFGSYAEVLRPGELVVGGGGRSGPARRP